MPLMSRLQRRQAEIVLQVERQIQEEREDRARDRDRGDLHAGERAAPEQRQRQHRLGDAPLDRDEGDEERAGPGEQRDDQGAPPALVVAAQQREHEHEQRGAERRDAGPVRARGVRVAALAQPQDRDGDRREADRHVEVEDRLPAERVGECAADERADRHGDADRRAVHAHRRAPLATGRELLRDQGQRHGEHHRPADALERPRQAEEGRIGRQGAQQRGEREDRQAGAEHATAPEAVGQRAGCQDERAQRQRVRVDHPLQVREARPEIGTDRRQRHVDHGDVEKQHEGRHRDGEQGPPLALHRDRSPCHIGGIRFVTPLTERDGGM
jgi:hypothetical protein